MRVISVKTLKDFWEKPGNGDSEQPLRAWYSEAKEADWEGPNDLKSPYHNASIIGSNRVAFDIKGNKYRLIVAIRYEFRIVYVRFIGTHREYDKVDARRV